MAHTQLLPTACHSEGLADILERVLDKGVVIAGDIKIKLCDIELLSIQIRLLVASVDKAREMGLTWWWQPPQQQPQPPHFAAGQQAPAAIGPPGALPQSPWEQYLQFRQFQEQAGFAQIPPLSLGRGTGGEGIGATREQDKALFDQEPSP
jgi:hypothetical protein